MRPTEWISEADQQSSGPDDLGVACAPSLAERLGRKRAEEGVVERKREAFVVREREGEEVGFLAVLREDVILRTCAK